MIDQNKKTDIFVTAAEEAFAFHTVNYHNSYTTVLLLKKQNKTVESLNAKCHWVYTIRLYSHVIHDTHITGNQGMLQKFRSSSKFSIANQE